MIKIRPLRDAAIDAVGAAAARLTLMTGWGKEVGRQRRGVNVTLVTLDMPVGFETTAA